MQAASPHARIRIVQSPQNARVKDLRAALRGNGRAPSGAIALEGAHLLGEALRSGLELQTIFVRSGSYPLLESILSDPQGKVDRGPTAAGEISSAVEVLELPAHVFAGAVATEHPQGIAALAVPPQFILETVLAPPSPLLLVLAGLQDPGNLGTLVRSAEAFGAAGILALPGTVSCWNPKALRS